MCVHVICVHVQSLKSLFLLLLLFFCAFTFVNLLCFHIKYSAVWVELPAYQL